MSKKDIETPAERARFMLSIFAVFFANFILIPGAVILVILTVVAIIDKSFMLVPIFLVSAVLCIVFNRIIIKKDDRYEEKRKQELEQRINTEIIADGGKFGKLKFVYNSEEEIMKLSGNQLRAFGNSPAFDVISYDTEGNLSCEVDFINQIYKDEDTIVKNMQSTFMDFLQKNGIETRKNDVYRIKFIKLSISKEREGAYAELSGIYECSDLFDEIAVLAGSVFGSGTYKYRAKWGYEVFD